MALTSHHPRLIYGIALLLFCVLSCFSLYLWNPIPLHILRNATFDQFQRIKPRSYQDTPVRIITIDDESLDRLGQWPWPRTRVAELLTILQAAQPKAIAIDIIFAENDRTSPTAMLDVWTLSAENRQILSALPDHDRILAKAIQQSNTALGFALTQKESRQPPPNLPARYVQLGASPLPHLLPFAGGVCSLPMLQVEAAGHGALSLLSDVDGIIRKMPLLLRHADSLVPSLVAETLRLAENTPNYTLKSRADGSGLAEMAIGQLRLSTSSGGEIWIHYSHADSRRYIPAWQVLAGQIDPDSLRDKILLIGTSAQGLMDIRYSPLGGVIPGIEVHAQALEQILSGEQLLQPHWTSAAEILVIVFGGLLIGGIALSSEALLAFGGFILLLGLLWSTSWYAYAQSHVLIDPMLPSLMLSLIFLFTSLFGHIYSERSQRWIKQAFSRYLSPNLVEHLLKHPEQLALSGQRQICSFVFTDLVDFTHLMESLDPAEAVSLLNNYLENMIAIAFTHQGTLDRIVGDALAIMFSAPVKQIDHQQRALQCALDMHQFASRFTANLKHKGIEFGQTRIGVHTGEVIVGNFGGKTIFDYRALGDAVNIASRLESANKYLGTLICVSEATLAGCVNTSVRPIGRLLVKGKSIPLNVFEPLSATQLDSQSKADYLAAHALMHEGNIPEAIAAFQKFVITYPDDKLAAFHLQRLLAGLNDDLIELTHK